MYIHSLHMNKSRTIIHERKNERMNESMTTVIVVGSLLRDKMVYLPIVSSQFVCIVDESKLSRSFGSPRGAPLPVEVTPFCCEHTRRLIGQLPALQKAGPKAVLRRFQKKDSFDISSSTVMKYFYMYVCMYGCRYIYLCMYLPFYLLVGKSLSIDLPIIYL